MRVEKRADQTLKQVTTGNRPSHDMLIERDRRRALPLTLSQQYFGDPPPGRSALDRRAALEAARLAAAAERAAQSVAARAAAMARLMADEDDRSDQPNSAADGEPSPATPGNTPGP
jgi:hypothetical protein